MFSTIPGVPIDDELLVALSVGLPVGLGIYLAWVHRDWSTQTWVHRDWSTQSKGLGLAAAVAGALVGAWLGFQATAGFIALVTTILGAVAGGNLVLILFNMVRAVSTGDRVASGTTADLRSTDVKPEAHTGAAMR